MYECISLGEPVPSSQSQSISYHTLCKALNVFAHYAVPTGEHATFLSDVIECPHRFRNALPALLQSCYLESDSVPFSRVFRLQK